VHSQKGTQKTYLNYKDLQSVIKVQVYSLLALGVAILRRRTQLFIYKKMNSRPKIIAPIVFFIIILNIYRRPR
jgi:hypothetical protein